jgi:Response regulator containing a CheY-like receiver domain and an HTH DNA-binding domain
MNPVRILIADDHEVVRFGVRAVIEKVDGWVVCGEANTGSAAVAQAIALRPDVVVLDVSMPELNGLEATRRILRVIQTSILILTMHESEEILGDVLNAGARGCLLKSDSNRTLVQAINAILRNKPFLSDTVGGLVRRLPLSGRAIDSEPRRDRLTTREREVLQLLTEGKGNKEIAALLQISVKTAETHRARMMAKLGLHSMSELVRYAVRNHIIQP